MTKKPLLITTAILLIAGMSQAAPYGDKDLKPTWDGKKELIFPQLDLSTPEKCRDSVDLGAMKNSQWSICEKLELNQIDLNLNLSYQSLRKKLSKEPKELLTRSQKTWLNFREEWCRFEQAQTDRGPMSEAMYINCLAEMTKKQIVRIEELSK